MGTYTTNNFFYKPAHSESGTTNLALWDAALDATDLVLQNLVSGNFSASVLPAVDNTYDLGSATYEWRDLYVDGTAYLDAADIGALTITAITLVNTINEFSTDGTLSGASDSAVPTEQAVKTYVDAQVAAINSFIELPDTPATYTGFGTQLLRVNVAETAVEFWAATGIDHNTLTNYSANRHIDHTAVTFTAGTGLTGGGDISANRTISLSHLGIQSLTDPNADRIMFWDDSSGYVDWLTVGSGLSIAGTTISVPNDHVAVTVLDSLSVDFTLTGQQITAAVLPAGVDHDSLSNFSADEHVDHTGVSISAGTGLTGGGTISANRTISLSHLGIQSLTDPNANRLMGWDDTDNSVQWITIGTNLSYDHASHTLSATAVGGVTLDGAYDYGGAGAGRTITADSGAVVINASVNRALDINQSSNVLSLYIVSASTTTGVLYVQNDSSTTGYLASFYSNSADTNTRDLVQIRNDNPLATGASCLWVKQDADYGAGAQGGVIHAVNDGTGHGVWIQQGGVLAASRRGLMVYSASNQTTGNALAEINMGSASSSIPALKLVHSGTGPVLTITQDINPTLYTVFIDAENTTSDVIDLRADVLTTGAMARFYTNAAHSGARVFDIVSDNALATGTVLRIVSDGTGSAIDVASASTTSNVISVTANSLTTGGLAYFYSNSSSASGRNLVSIISDHDSADNTNLLYLKGDGNPAGGLLFIENYSSGTGIYVYNYTVLGAGSHGLYVYSNVAHTAADSALVKIYQSLTTATEPALEVIGYGDDVAVYMESSDHTTLEIQMGSNPSTVNEHALYVWTSNARSSGASRGPLIKFEYTNASASDPLCLMKNAGTEGVLILEQDGSLEAGDHALEITSAATHGPSTTGDNALVKLVSSSASTTEPVLEIVNAGTAAAIEISSNTGVALQAADGDIRNVAWVDYSGTSTVTGWSSFTVKKIYYKKVGNLVFVTFTITGTSNSTSTSFTLPYTTTNLGTEEYRFFSFVSDNGGSPDTGVSTLDANANTLNIYKDKAAGSWTASGTKYVKGMFWYEANT